MMMNYTIWDIGDEQIVLLEEVFELEALELRKEGAILLAEKELPDLDAASQWFRTWISTYVDATVRHEELNLPSIH